MDKIIIFDGNCVLCNRTFQWILKADKKKQFRFGILQDEQLRTRLSKLFQDKDLLFSEEPETVILLEGDQVFLRSSAVLRICSHLGGFYRIMVVLRLTPKIIRDAIYRWIARNRYGWFGRQSCYIPDESVKNRFI
jgi:predicted DCC family thiol-disulfide oxidoreductase YuxK